MIDEYVKSWNKFSAYCEKKAKGRAILTAKCWQKLGDYHLEQFLKNHHNPYLFLFTVKMNRRDLFNRHRMQGQYQIYTRKRIESLNPLIHGNFYFHR